MQHLNIRFRRSVTAGPIALAVGLLTVTLALRAEQAPAQGAAPKPLVPMTASSLLRDPASHMGENVSLMAAVETVLSKTAFTVDQDKTKATGKELLVLVPTLTAAPGLNTYVTVQGEVMRFDPAEIAKRARSYTIDLTPDQLAKYKGQPVVLATVVVTMALVDLAKRPIVPMTADELKFAEWMKAINTAAPAVRTGLDQPNAVQLKDQVALLKQSFAEVEAYFKGHGLPADAVKLASDAAKLTAGMDVSLLSGKLEEIRAASGTLQQMCATCHGQFRERQDDGSYRIKSGG